jgi:hypothetical protein
MEPDLHPITCLYGIHRGNYVTLSCKGGMISVLREGCKGYSLVFLPIILLSSFFCLSRVYCVFVCLLNWPNIYSECVAHHSHSNHTLYVSGCSMSVFIMIIPIILGVCVYYRLICFLEIKVL